jgi:diaminopimelate epimerase
MSTLTFVKYQGAGNDFILIDDRALSFDPAIIPQLCHRKFGIGSDGVILLQHDSSADFRMRIFNSDGSEAESCGNGLRCLMRFLVDLGLPKQNYRIATQERVVRASFHGDKIKVEMGEAAQYKRFHIEGHEVHFINTGVPHAVVFGDADFLTLASLLRHHKAFQPSGTNVNLARLEVDGSIYVRTYERGVEGETMACGTGAAAVGVIASQMYQIKNPIRISFSGGEMEIYVDQLQVAMIGDALKVFEGRYPVQSQI